MAIVMPKMPIIFPCLAVLGEANPLIEKIKNMLAKIYEKDRKFDIIFSPFS